jgi:hypothetical protein
VLEQAGLLAVLAAAVIFSFSSTTVRKRTMTAILIFTAGLIVGVAGGAVIERLFGKFVLAVLWGKT